MRIITLLTDWENDDYYKAVAKASILSKVSDVQIVDISHKAKQYHISRAAFLLESAINQFPKGSIHLFGIITVATEGSKVIIGEYNGQYIIANNNGLFNILNIKFDKLVEVSTPISNFPVAESFAPLAVRLIKGESIDTIGNSILETAKFNTINPVVEEDRIICTVSYIDSYGNLLINIKKDFFEQTRKGRDFEILLNSLQHKSNKISEHYNQVDEREIFSIFNSAGWLEIGIRMDNISKILSITEETSIIIKFL